jgi:rRNA-processing protein FCF1
MPAGQRSPFDGTTRLIVDGTNLLYRLGRGSAAPPAAVIGRLRAAVPATIAIDLVFDGQGHGVFGRLAQGMFVRYSNRRPADDVILDLTSEAAMEAGGGPGAGGAVLVVTNDRELRDRLALKGARTAPLQWLIDRMGLPVLASAAAGNKRPTIGAGTAAGVAGGPGSAPGIERDADRRGWKPGRGATSKIGPAKRVARHKRHPRMGA